MNFSNTEVVPKRLAFKSNTGIQIARALHSLTVLLIRPLPGRGQGARLVICVPLPRRHTGSPWVYKKTGPEIVQTRYSTFGTIPWRIIILRQNFELSSKFKSLSNILSSEFPQFHFPFFSSNSWISNRAVEDLQSRDCINFILHRAGAR